MADILSCPWVLANQVVDVLILGCQWGPVRAAWRDVAEQLLSIDKVVLLEELVYVVGTLVAGGFLASVARAGEGRD